MSLDRIINVSSARGESQADILRRTGLFGVLPTDDDATAIGKLNADAAASAALAESVSGPTYASPALGLSATSDGESFAVDNGDGTVSIYLNAAGVAVFQRSLATTAKLASDSGGEAIGVKTSLIGAVVRTVLDWFTDELSVMSFIPAVERVKIRLRTATVDSSLFINAAYAAAEAAGGREVVWPAGKYRTESTVICGPLSSTRAVGGAVLEYAGDGSAMVVEGVNTSETTGQLHLMPSIVRTTLGWNGGTDTTSVGLILQDRKYNTFIIPGVKRFNEGLAFKANVANFVCNTIQLGVLQNNRIGLDFSRVTAGYGINQNTIVGGAIATDSTYTGVAGRIYINMPNAGENNTNTFIGTNLEKGGNEKAIFCASSNNLFLNCRFEAGGTTAGYVTVTGNLNKFIGPAPVWPTTAPFTTWVADTGSANVFWSANILANKYFVIDFNSGSKPIRFGNGSAFPSVPIGPYGTDRLMLGDSSTLGVRHYGYVLQEESVVTSGASIPGKQHQQLNYASPQTIVSITGGFAQDLGGIFTLTDLNGNITLFHTAAPAAGAGRFVLKGGANLAMSANTPVVFVLVNGNLYQV